MRIPTPAAAVAAAILAVSVAGCTSGTPGDAAGAKVIRNLLAKKGVNAQVVSFRKTQGKEVHNGGGDAFEFQYEAEFAFPEGYDAKCVDEKERGACAYLGIAADQAFKKGEVFKTEGTLTFVRKDKSWLAEDNNAY
jgi:hypothetical protein